MPRCAFIGLGVMGYPMAGYLHNAGNHTTVYNRTVSKAEKWVETHGGSLGATPCEAAQGADVVMLCVGNDDDVRSVVYGEAGVLEGMPSGSVLVDHTTASAFLAKELEEACAEKGIGFVDAPISGGQAGAEAGQLSVMCGGSQEAFAKIEPVIDIYSKISILVGPAGHGQLTKMVNQICIGGLLQGLSEALEFAKRSKLDTEKVLQAISQGASASWYLSNRSETMLAGEFNHGFAVDWMRKDFGIVFDEAERISFDLPVTSLVDSFFAELQEKGHSRSDVSSLIELLAEK